MLKKYLAALIFSICCFFVETALANDRFYVYSSHFPREERFHPTGYMGDTLDLDLSEARIKTPSNSERCLRVTYRPRGEKGWVGLYWQNPPDNWGDMRGGYNLTGAERLTFWIKGGEGARRVSAVKVGGIMGEHSDTASYTSHPIRLTDRWRKYEIDLKGLDLRYISGGFAIILNSNDFHSSGGEFYIDEIRYEGAVIKALDEIIGRIPLSVSLQTNKDEFYLSEKDEIVFLPHIHGETIIDGWSLEIFDKNRIPAKNIIGSGSEIPGEIKWDGRDIAGRYVHEGEYRAVFAARDNEGKREVSSVVSFNALEGEPDVPVVKKIETEKIPERQSFLVYFEFGEAEITEQTALDKIKEISDIFKKYNYTSIQVSGHTDNIGSAEMNLKLSKKRASIVADHLVKNLGIEKDKITVIGFGEEKPIETNLTASGRAKNRRVEIILKSH